MRIRLFIVSCIVGMILIAGLILSQPNAQAQQNSAISPKPLSLSQIASQATVLGTSNSGQPAITPASSASNVAGKNATNANTTLSPRIKASDVQTYVFGHGFPSGPLVAGATLKVSTIDLITSKEASVRLNGELLGVPDTTQVYFVKIQGPFATTMAPLPSKAKILKQAPYGIEVFDATSGNLLIWSIPTK